jgi:hypothetical protein
VNEPVNGGRQDAAIFTKLEYLIFKSSSCGLFGSWNATDIAPGCCKGVGEMFLHVSFAAGIGENSKTRHRSLVASASPVKNLEAIDRSP